MIKFSKAFQKKFNDHVLKGEINPAHIMGLRSNTVRYYPFITKKGFQDVRQVFRQTASEDTELMEHYARYWHPTNSVFQNARVIAKAVNREITYTTDLMNFKQAEYWATPIDTFRLKKDDCDGYSNLIVKVCRLFGAKDYEIFTRAGNVKHPSGRKAGAHANVVVFNPEDFQYYPLEGSFYDDLSMKEYGKTRIQDHPRYYNTWFIVNDVYSYGRIPGWQLTR